jgi:hypothetical protein
MSRSNIFSVFVFIFVIHSDAENDPNAAARCDYANCTLPNCFCSVDGTLIPGNLEANQVRF